MTNLCAMAALATAIFTSTPSSANSLIVSAVSFSAATHMLSLSGCPHRLPVHPIFNHIHTPASSLIYGSATISSDNVHIRSQLHKRSGSVGITVMRRHKKWRYTSPIRYVDFRPVFSQNSDDINLTLTCSIILQIHQLC